MTVGFADDDVVRFGAGTELTRRGLDTAELRNEFELQFIDAVTKMYMGVDGDRPTDERIAQLVRAVRLRAAEEDPQLELTDAHEQAAVGILRVFSGSLDSIPGAPRLGLVLAKLASLTVLTENRQRVTNRLDEVIWLFFEQNDRA